MRHHLSGHGIAVVAWILLASLIAVVQPTSAASAAEPSRSARLVRTFDLDDLAISNPAGLAFSTADGTFHVLESTRGASDVAVKQISPHEVRKDLARIAAQVTDPVNVTFDDLAGRLLMYATPADHIISVDSDASGNLDPSSLTRANAHSFGVSQPKGMAVDPATGDLLIFDQMVPSIVRVTPAADGSFSDATTTETQLTGLTDPTSLAVHPSTGHLFVASSTRPELYELNASGDLLATWDISEAELLAPGGMVFAASGDLTDDPDQMSLYITDTGEAPASAPVEGERVSSLGPSLRVLAAAETSESDGQIAEVSLVEAEVTATATETFTSTLVQEIEAFNWSPPSPDTSGVTYLPASNTLMAVDGEVNEMSIYAGANVWESTLGGSVVDTWATDDFGNNEPTGVSVDPSDGTLYISRDTPPKEIYVWDPGANGTYETSDSITSFVTADFGATDPEGVSYGAGLDRLFIADGLNNEIYQLAPGSNGVFDGVPPSGDDVLVDSFDILSLGMEDPEGVAYNPDTGTLYIGGKTRDIGSHNFDTLLEVTITGSLVRYIDVGDINPNRQYNRQKLSGLGYGPSSVNAGQMVIYIADRGEDNNNDPNENDGRIYEATLPGGTAPTNRAPVANDDSAETSQDTSVNVDVTANDSDIDGNLDLTSVTTVSGPSNGSTVDNNDGTIDYTPGASFTGADQFTYEICDTDGLCDTAVVDMTVTESNDPPTANDDSATTDEDTTVNVDVVSNDTDPQGNGTLDLASVTTVSGPSNGSTVDNNDGTIDYTPDTDFNGADQFTYEICDDLGLCDTAIVDVTVDPVDDPPVANDDSASTSVDTSVVIDVASNDSDVDGNLDPVSATPVTQPSDGAAVGLGDGTIRYDPDPGFSGPDSFTYEICDTGGLCDTATVNVTMSGDQIIYVTSTSGGSVGGVSFGDEDILALDTSTGTWSMFFDGSDVGLGDTGQEVDAFHLDSDGSILLSLGVGGTIPDIGAVEDYDIIRFVPSATGVNTAGNYEMYVNGEDFGLSTSGEDIDSLGLAPDGRLVVSFRGSYSVPGLSGKDVDLVAFDASTSTWSLYLDGPAVGLDGGNTEDVTAVSIDPGGAVHLSARSSFDVPGLSGDSADIFTCDPQNSNPISSCDFSLLWDGGQDGFGGESINGMFVSGSGGGGGGPTNSPPDAVDDTTVTSVDTPVVVDVASNDSDVDGNLDPSSASPASQPSNGSASGNGDGTLTYTPDTTYTGPDSFTYEICDTDGECDTATVDVNVTQPNDPPEADDDIAGTDEDSAVVIDVASNDSDVDGNLDPSTTAPVTQPSNGTASGNSDGTITYTPNQDFNGADSFTYEICDTLGSCSTATVNITVDPVNDEPVANDDSASTSQDTSVVVDVASNDDDVDANLDPATAAPTSQPSNGTATGNSDGTITYTPDPGHTGSDSFTYQICDDNALCDVATVNMTITAAGGGSQVLYVSSTSGGSVGGVSFRDEDILAYDTSTGAWSIFFDGSDVGLGDGSQEVDAFYLNSDGSMLLSLGDDGTIPDVGAVEDHDIVKFIPASTGDNTAGTYEMYFNGGDHDLADDGEDIDALGFAPDGRLVVSFRGYYSVTGISGRDVDLLAFDSSSGTWSLYMDGVAVGLDGGNIEDVTAVSIDSNGDIHLSVRSSFDVPGLSGDSADIFTCTPQSSNPISSCTFNMSWDGSEAANGFGGESINALFVAG